jgi:hypothetical protein
MSTFYRLILALVILSFLIVGCQASVAPTPIPATGTPLKPESTIAPTVSPETAKNSSDKNAIDASSSAYLGQTPPV